MYQMIEEEVATSLLKTTMATTALDDVKNPNWSITNREHLDRENPTMIVETMILLKLTRIIPNKSIIEAAAELVTANTTKPTMWIKCQKKLTL